MPRIARAVAVGFPHHITQRGNFGMDVFPGDDDRRKYLSWLRQYAQAYGLEVWAWCLMSNHVHFVAVPRDKESLARTFNQTHMRYAQWRNRSAGQRGHLWQGRFFSCVLDNAHTLAAMRYVERNPVRAGMVKRAEDYGWSSARARVLGGSDPLVRLRCAAEEEIRDWRVFLSAEPEESLPPLRLATRTGRPLGDETFVAGLERRLRRVLHAQKAGRPRKKRKR